MSSSMPDFSAQTRRENVDRMRSIQFDILIIGGGGTGAAVARDAALRGYNTALVEQSDFASGTSSKSSRLVHGGLRYLENFEFGLVFEGCRERRRLLRTSPNLVRPLPFVFPVHAGDPRPLWQVAIGMWLYDAMAVFRNIERHQIWGKGRTLREEAVINPDGLTGATHYYDATTDDARLTLTIALDAHRAGATLANHMQVVGLLCEGHQVVGVQVRDQLTDDEIEVRARIVVNATGPWTDALLKMADPHAARRLRPTKGVHLIVPHQRIRSQAAITLNSPRDGRLMFLIPWGRFSIIGTTDTDYADDPADVQADAEDVAYILEAAGRAFPVAGLSEADVISAYAGLRPLIAEDAPSSGYKVSREHQILNTTPGLFTIAGGKLTTWRSMAQEMVDELAGYLAREHGLAPARPCQTAHRMLPGGDIDDWHCYLARQVVRLVDRLSPETIVHLVSAYGTGLTHVLAQAEDDLRLVQPLIAGLPYLKAEVVHAVRYEMAITLEDVLARRTRILDQDGDQGLEVAAEVAQLMAAELNWSAQEQVRQVDRYRRVVQQTRRWRG
ncbi:MAG: glycerol-3-phosphate dehydrogenase [Anaerolineales bacterium]|nr:MAG: glycerol-3-phosphate dehydrogenase [Anaerolineales bacterium]